MNPNTPAPNTPSSGNFDSSQFDFIMNPGQSPKKSLLPGGPKQRMIFFVLGGATIVTVLLVIIFSIFTGSSPATEQLVSITQQQQELMRISGAGSSKVQGPQAKKLATITNSVVTTDQKAVIDYLAKQNKKMDSKQLRLLEDKKTDEALAAADRNGRYDEVFIQLMIEQLTKYRQALEVAHSQTGPAGKEILKQSYDNITLILEDNKP